MPLAIAFLALAWWLKSLSGPAVGTLAQSSVPVAEVKALNEPGSYKGKYVSFTYPANYRITEKRSNSTYLESVTLYTSNHTNKQIAVSVLREPMGQESGVLLRKAHPETYHQQPADSGKLLFASTASGSELTQFMSHNDLMMSVSITCPYQHDLAADLATVTESFKWN